MHSWRSQRQARIHLKGGFIFAFSDSAARVRLTGPGLGVEAEFAHRGLEGGGGEIARGRRTSCSATCVRSENF